MQPALGVLLVDEEDASQVHDQAHRPQEEQLPLGDLGTQRSGRISMRPRGWDLHRGDAQPSLLLTEKGQPWASPLDPWALSAS